jgi:hypothetical protein
VVNAKAPRRQGFWLTAGEIVGVLALVIAGLNYWDSHTQHVREDRRERAQASAGRAFVIAADSQDGGRRLGLRSVRADQVISSQKFIFPTGLGAAPRSLTASAPRIDADWLAGPLAHTLAGAHAAASGDARLPVAVQTSYVEDGETRQDISLYDVGYSWRRRLIGGEEIRLQGVALVRRGLGASAQAAVDSRWTRERPAPVDPGRFGH